MKKILLLTLMLIVSMTITVFADTDNGTDAKKAIDAIKEIRYTVEAGTNLGNYNNVVLKAGVECRRYADKYPEVNNDTYPKSSLNMMLEPYVDAGKVWHNAVYEDPRYYGINKALKESELSLLFGKYPKLKTMVTTYPDAAGKQVYWYEDIIRALWNIAADQEKILDIKPTK